MPSILVVEHEGRYIERIQDALMAEGWQPRFVAGRPEALRAAASEAPNLVLVNAELPGAPELLKSFARRHGGPGAVALVAEQGSGEGLDADEILSKPFSDQELRLAVRRGLSAAEKATVRVAVIGGEDRKLTSSDIFGDLLAEVEGELGEGRTEGEADGGSPGPGVEAAAPPPAPPGPREAPTPGRPVATGPAAAAEGSAPPAAPAPRPPAVSLPPPRRRDADESDMELLLEQTLSGVLDAPRRRAAAPAPKAPPPAPAASPPQKAPAAPDRPRAGGEDVDRLLNMTLSSLDLEGRRTGTPRAAAAPTGRTRHDADLAELEALAGRRPRHRGAAPEPPPPPPATEVAPPPAAAPPEAVGEELPIDFSLDLDLPDDDRDLAAELAPEAEAPLLADEDVMSSAWVEEAPPPLAAEPPSAPAESGVRDAPEPPLPASDPGAPAAVDAPAGAGGERRFGHYTLLDRIAVGGMAEVWKARMSGVEGFQKVVAIKKILPHMTEHSDFVSMFIDEAKLAAQLNHPNITHIYDLGKLGDDYYIAMEYVDGRNLRAILNDAHRKNRPLPVGLALLVAARLASALDYAHRKRDFDGQELELVHRDVSPQNVLISEEGDIKLCDFGISKAVAKVSQTETGALKGKLQYMSPEQAWGRPVDARSDIFSLGTLLFEMLTGQRLFTGDSELSVLEAVRECRVRSPRQVNPRVPDAVDTLVMRALERDADRRFRTAGEMRQAVEALLDPMRPTPGQGDLAVFLAELAAAPVPPPKAAPEGEPPGARGEEARSGSAPGISGTASRPAARAPADVSPAAGGTGVGTGVGNVPILHPRGAAAVDEGPLRRPWLLASILLLVVAAVVVAWLLFGRPEPVQTVPGSGPAEEAPAAPAPVEEEPVAEATGPDTEAAAPDGEAAPSATAAEEAVTLPDLEALVDERLAAEEQRLRRQYEEQQRRLEAELARVRAATQPAEGEEPPAGEASGEEREQTPEDDAPPPAAAARPADGAAPPALVSTAAAGYPSDARAARPAVGALAPRGSGFRRG